MQPVVDRLLPCTMVGSYPRPRWYRRTSYGQDLRELLMDAAWREEYEDALKGVLNDQVTAGLDILSDGEVFEDDYYGSTGWPDYVVGRLVGRPVHREVRVIPGSGPSRSPILQHLFEEGWPTPMLTSSVEHGPLRFGYLYQMVARFSGGRPVKASFIDPQLAAGFLQDRYYGSQPGVPAEALVMDVVEIYREELRDLAGAGCPIFQSDLPPFATLGMANAAQQRWELAVRAFNRMVDDAGDMQIWMHYCWGRPFGQLARGEAGDFRPMFPHVFDANFHVLNIECGDCLGPEMELLEQVPADRGVAVGIINHRALQVETAEQVADRIRRALQHIRAERLMLTTYCGLANTLPRPVAYFKLKALADGAAIVRAELTGTRPPEPSPVAVGA